MQLPTASSWEQLLARMVWRRNTGDLDDKTGKWQNICWHVFAVSTSDFNPASDVCTHLYVVVAVLGEEQELDRSPLRNRLDLGPPARGLSGV